MTAQSYDIVVGRNDLANVRIVPASPVEVAENQIHVSIESYALTANNITYGVAGETMKYWSFYPAPAGMGRIPVWGFGRVLASKRPEVAAGERLYGYWPMSSDVLLTIGAATPGTLTETSANRAGLSAVYNTYTRVAADPGMSPGSEPYVALIRPLFATSFLVDDFLAENAFFGAKAVVLTSASSKTAMGLAHCLKQRGPERPEIVGLTSQRNVAFVARLGTYDSTVPYDAIGSLKAPNGAVVVDMAGGEATLRAIHSTLADDLKYSCRVGFTQWQDAKAAIPGLPGVRPVFFFAPDRAKARLADWGPKEFGKRVGAALAAFIVDAQGWLKLETHQGAEAIVAAYRALLKGDAPPDVGIICKP